MVSGWSPHWKWWGRGSEREGQGMGRPTGKGGKSFCPWTLRALGPASPSPALRIQRAGDTRSVGAAPRGGQPPLLGVPAGTTARQQLQPPLPRAPGAGSHVIAGSIKVPAPLKLLSPPAPDRSGQWRMPSILACQEKTGPWGGGTPIQARGMQSCSPTPTCFLFPALPFLTL